MKLNISPLARRILRSRGLEGEEDIYRFLYPKLSELSNPFLLPDIEKAIERVIKALVGGENICLFGDYDTDGITSIAIFYNFLKKLSVKPFVYIPKRSEGYGLRKESIEFLREKGVTLIVCLDCGSSNVEEIKFAKKLGIDTIVIDHHEIKRPYPEAVGIVNPKRDDSIFSTRELASCGVTFFFLMALRRRLLERSILKERINLKRELDLVALGTYGDMVPLTGDNRILVRYGLQVMKENPKSWLQALRQKRVVTEDIDEWVINFLIVPRINAPGRISDPFKSFIFLTTEDPFKVEEMIDEISILNLERQKMEEEILKEGIEIIEKEGLLEKKFLVLLKKGWPLGILGLVAQKITELYERPSIVLTESDGIWKGSGRGVEGFDLYGRLSSISHLFARFGGHKYACGLSITEENLVKLKEEVERLAEGFKFKQKPKRIDAEAEFSELMVGFAEFMDLMSPFGPSNPRPNLLFRPSSIEIENGDYVKILDERNVTWDGILRTNSKFPFSYILASPYVKRKGDGERYVYLYITDFLE